MENLKIILETIETKDLEINFDKKVPAIKQTVRNDLKRELVDAIHTALSTYLVDYRILKTSDGVAIEIENEKSNVVVTLDPIFKNLEYDILHESEEYEIKEQARLDLLETRKNKSK